VITAEELRAGFFVDGQRIPLINPQRGIFKPASMKYLLSVRTVYPRTGTHVWYDDQRTVRTQIERGDELVDYAFMGADADAADNRWLRDARDSQIPILYFLGVAPQRYTFVWPTYVVEWLAAELKVRLAFGTPAAAGKEWSIPEAPERRYGLRLVRHRLQMRRVCRTDAEELAGKIAEDKRTFSGKRMHLHHGLLGLADRRLEHSGKSANDLGTQS
jgi:putative restriction endonuclease